MADITLINLNMLFMRYGEEIERELHVPLGCLYLTRALADSGFEVDFRDYQSCPARDPFDLSVFLDFASDPAPVIGLSCMANLLPFTIAAAEALKQRFPDRTLLLGGVGATSVEESILRRFPAIDVICRGEGERTAPELLRALRTGGDLAGVDGISFRSGEVVVHNPDRPRIQDLDALPSPAFERIELEDYAGYGLMTSRGCPYPCSFCSVAPIWRHETHSLSPRRIVAEMEQLNQEAGVELFLFQDEFFVSTKAHVMTFCEELERSGLDVRWKAFGRVNLTDVEMMETMVATGCIELRFGIESGSDRILSRIRKGFTARDVFEVVPEAIELFPRVDMFYIWGFPFESMEDFDQTLMQMVSFRMMGARILPSLLSLLPQTEIFRDLPTGTRLEFCPHLLPEFVLTGHEVYEDGRVVVPERHRRYFELIRENPDIFPGFHHVDLEGNVLPKLDRLREFGFYPDPSTRMAKPERESCGAHSPRVGPHELASNAGH